MTGFQSLVAIGSASPAAVAPSVIGALLFVAEALRVASRVVEAVLDALRTAR